MSLPSFINPKLLETALTHRSALNEKLSKSKESNERLEFLGDAVLELLTSRFLYDLLPREAEGKLSALRSALVKTTTLAQIAKELKLDQKLYMSRGEEASGGRENPKLLADSVEAFLGALYLDQGLEKVLALLEDKLFPKLERIQREKLYKDAKSLLQEVVQAQGFEAPDYQVISEEGPDHEKIFTVEVSVGEKPAGKGTGKSKQDAQQAAAKKALTKYN